MTIAEMGERLRTEFPGKYVSFEIEVNKYDHSDRVEATVKIYEPSAGFIEAHDFETCVSLLKSKLNPVPVNEGLDVEFGPA